MKSFRSFSLSSALILQPEILLATLRTFLSKELFLEKWLLALLGNKLSLKYLIGFFRSKLSSFPKNWGKISDRKIVTWPLSNNLRTTFKILKMVQLPTPLNICIWLILILINSCLQIQKKHYYFILHKQFRHWTNNSKLEWVKLFNSFKTISDHNKQMVTLTKFSLNKQASLLKGLAYRPPIIIHTTDDHNKWLKIANQ